MNTKLLFENWRKFVKENIQTDISSLIDEDVALFRGSDNDKRIYALYNHYEARRTLQRALNNGEELPFLSNVIGASLFAVLQTTPSREGGSPFGARQVKFVISNKSGYGRLLYSIVSFEESLMSDRAGSVSNLAQKVWKDFFNSSEKLEIDPNTGDVIGEIPDKMVRAKIDNYEKPKTPTKKDDGKVYSEEDYEFLNYAYRNNATDKSTIDKLKNKSQKFVEFLYQTYPNLNPKEIIDTFTSQGAQAFDKKYSMMSDRERVVNERKLGKPSSETNLGDWFKRKGAPGKKGGWVDCNTCRNGKCKPCGRQEGEKRSKYPRCRPTPAQCKGYKRRGDNLQKGQ